MTGCFLLSVPGLIAANNSLQDLDHKIHLSLNKCFRVGLDLKSLVANRSLQ